jgi:hypothetical protein
MTPLRLSATIEVVVVVAAVDVLSTSNALGVTSQPLVAMDVA